MYSKNLLEEQRLYLIRYSSWHNGVDLGSLPVPPGDHSKSKPLSLVRQFNCLNLMLAPFFILLLLQLRCILLQEEEHVALQHSTWGWSIPIIAHSQGTHYTPLSRGALRAVTGVLIPYMAGIGLTWVWLRYSVTKKSNRLVLRLLYIFYACLSVPTYHVCNNYVM